MRVEPAIYQIEVQPRGLRRKTGGSFEKNHSGLSLKLTVEAKK